MAVVQEPENFIYAILYCFTHRGRYT